MLNFTYRNTTELVFGRGVELEIGTRVREALGKEGRLVLLTGGGSVKRSGLLDRVTQSLREAGHRIEVYDGIQPNPQMQFVRDLKAKLTEPVDMIIGVGGGSVIDTAKALAMAIPYDGDPWDFFNGKATPTEAVPVAALVTMPATGTEQSIRTVMSDGPIKTGAGTQVIRPRLAFINPELYFTIPSYHIGASLVDMMSHIMERYFSATPNTTYVDAQAEAAMRVILRFGPQVYENPEDYDAWCQIAMCGTFAHNGYFGLGRLEDWACHAMEHALSGWNEKVTHGAGLAVIIPNWMQYVSEKHPQRFVQFAVNVMRVEPQVTEGLTIQLGIAKLCAFYQTLGMPLTLREVGAEGAPIESIAAQCCEKGPVGKLQALDKEDVVAILTAAAG